MLRLPPSPRIQKCSSVRPWVRTALDGTLFSFVHDASHRVWIATVRISCRNNTAGTQGIHARPYALKQGFRGQAWHPLPGDCNALFRVRLYKCRT